MSYPSISFASVSYSSFLCPSITTLSTNSSSVSISEKNKVEFGTKLIEYYEDENKLSVLISFIYNNCIDGIG